MTGKWQEKISHSRSGQVR